jgi:hypothetical protein
LEPVEQRQWRDVQGRWNVMEIEMMLRCWKRGKEIDGTEGVY